MHLTGINWNLMDEIFSYRPSSWSFWEGDSFTELLRTRAIIWYSMHTLYAVGVVFNSRLSLLIT